MIRFFDSIEYDRSRAQYEMMQGQIGEHYVCSWEFQMDAGYCLDAPRDMPAGSTKVIGELDTFAVSSKALILERA